MSRVRQVMDDSNEHELFGGPKKINGKKVQKRNMKIAILCAGQMFGNEDVLRGRNYTTTVRCITTLKS